MRVHIVKERIQEDNSLIRAADFALDQLNLIQGRGDFNIHETSRQEIVLRNTAACSTFCIKKERCDAKFCDQYHRNIQQGIRFIDNRIKLYTMKCANLNDAFCEVRITFSS